MTHVINRNEFERIKASISGMSVAERTRLDRKEELKQLSEDKKSKWPNTLEATRKKKESFLKDREDKAELRRQEVDLEEAEIRRKQRLDAISRANDLLYDQTDRMKMLKSKKLYSDVLHNRTFQVQHKIDVKEVINKEAAEYHQVILSKVREGDEAERAKELKRMEQIKLIAIARKEQLDDARAKRERDQQEQVAIGLGMKKRAQDMLEEEIRMHDLKHKKAEENKNAVLSANEKLKLLRIQLAQEERRAEESRDAEVQVIEGRKNERKAIEIRFQEKAQLKRQSIIDAAVKLLAERTNTENAVLMKQETEIKDREDKAIADKAARRKAEWDAIVKSRTDMLNKKDEEFMQQYEDDERLAKIWREENDKAIKSEHAKADRAHQNACTIKSIQYTDGQSRRRKAVEDRLLELEEDRVLQGMEGDVGDRFLKVCHKTISTYEAQGKPTYPLKVALAYKEPVLIGAKLNKDRPQKKE